MNDAQHTTILALKCSQELDKVVEASAPKANAKSEDIGDVLRCADKNLVDGFQNNGANESVIDADLK